MTVGDGATGVRLRRRSGAAALALVLAACGARSPRLPYAGADLDAFLAAHPLAAQQSIRLDEIGRTATASYHVVQVRGAETPHRHATHDLTVVVLRGRGTFNREGRAMSLRAGDAVVIPRGEAHWFANGGRGAAVSFVIFAPPLDAPDSVPVDGR